MSQVTATDNANKHFVRACQSSETLMG